MSAGHTDPAHTDALWKASDACATSMSAETSAINELDSFLDMLHECPAERVVWIRPAGCWPGQTCI